jgi:hypothetical protein
MIHDTNFWQAEQPDDNEPTPERQHELRAAYSENVNANRAPYTDVWIRTRGELFWIMHEHNWLNKDNTSKNRSVNLSGARFTGTDLSGVFLSGADLSNSYFFRADLSSAKLWEANLKGSYLCEANLNGAWLWRANLSDTNLIRANLSGTHLREAKLCNSNLQESWMDVTTRLRSIVLDSQTRLAGVIWSGVPLTHVDWSKIPILGDEQDIALSKNRGDRIEAQRMAARAYRGLAIELQKQGLTNFASHYRLREQRLERHSLLLERKIGAWIFSKLLDLVSGYGEKPSRALIAYLIVVFVFMLAYYSVTNFLQPPHLSWDEALVLSITSFHGRGFFPNFLSLGDWIARLAAIEAIIGLFIELIFIATFSRRFLNS